ncbi:ISH3 family transposase, partial [Halobacterium salinarum]|uniref:ISH3 family transposase n=1 Tax=Halobacterium salinarum TaxID=2242 RepID=UPI002556D00D
MSKTKQADSVIHEDQLLNFLVNRLDEEVPLSLANNAEITAEDIYEVLVGACADGTSVSTLCASSQNAPAANTILYHLRTKFEPERLERVANALLRKNLDELLPKQVEVCADLHLRPYYGDEADTDGLYHSEAKRGTTAFHAYATLYARVKNKRYTLAVRRLEDGDTASSVLAEFLGILDGLDTKVKAVYLDRGFYDSKCLTLLQAHNYAYVIPIIRWGKTIQQELSEGWSRVIQHDLTGKLDGHSWTVEFPVYIDCTY